MLTPQEQFNKHLSKCWQAVTLLDAMAKSRLNEMDGIDISVALEGIHGILLSAISEIEELDIEVKGGVHA